MATLFNYQILQKLGESMHSEVFKVHALNQPEKIQLLRKIKPRFNSVDVKEYLQQQIEQLSKLSLAQSVIPNIKSGNNTFFLIQDFFTDYTLTHWLQQQPTVNFENILTLAISIAQCLEDIHKAGHIHKGLKPNNILLKPDTLEVQIIDNIRVLDVNQLSHFIHDPQFCTHSLPYLSPEQTEKIKYSVNYNADLYALGMILYQALTGSPPFLFKDPIAILHSHLAETPQRIEIIKPEIPEILGDIVEQLLQKAPEKRYQTASGLKIDLEQCLSQWKTNQIIYKFILKRKDFSHQITIPSSMVGRDDEKKGLLAEFEKAANGMFRSAFISGDSGIGKTRLNQELQRPIISRHGYYCAGKADQFKPHIPYSILIQAFTRLIKLYLTEDSQQQHYWQSLILGSLGDNARIMTDLIPELELIIGKPPEIPELPPVEALLRFNDTVGLFISCQAKKQHPLVLFLDDLQWCDSASFDLLDYIFANTLNYPYLFLIGAYRHKQVDNSHRLTRLLQKANRVQQPMLQIRLESLSEQHVNQMTADILNTYPSRTKTLAHVIYHTSAGNPLFINECLSWLHNYQHLHFDDNGIWTWDEQQLRHAIIPDSALDLFKDKIKKLPAPLQELLGIAAFLGTRFDAKNLALSVNISLADLYSGLAEAFEQNILLREKQQILFFHDQVQAAAERLVGEENENLVHYQIAMALIKVLPDPCHYEALDNLFIIVEHLSAAGRPAFDDEKACFQEARLNYAAGRVSLRSLAIESANYYFNLAKQIYSYRDWESDYSFLYSLHKYLARTEIALGHQDKSEQILDLLIRKSNNDIDKADCFYEQSLRQSSLGDFKKSIASGNRGLDYFNHRIPDNDDKAMEKVEQLFAEIHQNKRDVWQEILQIKPGKDRALLIEAGICGNLIADYYLSGLLPQLFLAGLQATRNALLGGIDDTISLSFSIVGLYLQRKGEFKLALKYEQLALAFIERYPNTFGSTRGMNGLVWLNSHNHETSNTLIERCQQNLDRGKRCGDLYHTGIAYGPYIWYLIHQGHDMQGITEVATECVNFSNKYHLSLSWGLGKSILMGWSALMQLETQKISPSKTAQIIAQWEEDTHLVSIGAYYITAGMAYYFLGKRPLAIENLEHAKPYLRGLTDNILNRLWYVFRFLSRLHSSSATEDEESTQMHCLQQVTLWAELGPILKPYLALMIAEQAFHTDDFRQARYYYLDAIDSSYQHRYKFLEAFAQQRLGELHLKHQHRNAQAYLQQALVGYQQCGADVKAQQITAEYAIVIPENRDRDYASLGQLQDIKYLLKVSRQITQELDFNTLLSTIMKAIMERLGVQNGFLLIADNQSLSLFAKGEKKDVVNVLIKSIDSITTTTLSMAITHYVFHTEQSVLLHNACHEGDFITDNVVIKQQLKSIFCLPLIKQKKVLGVLYLENHLVADVFNSAQIEQTELLTAQAAIALHNTLLMQEMRENHDKISHFNKTLEQRVTERTQALHGVNEELKNFAYIVSHDLKAPLRAINQLSGWIENDYAETFGEEGRQQMALLRSRAKRMHEMIEGILQYSRIGRTKIIYETVDLNLLFADIVNIIAPPKHINLVVQSHLPTIMADKISLFQVIQNLLDNAIKYNDKKQGQIQFNCITREHDWYFTLQDNGIGIAEKDQHKVFQLFQTLAAKDISNSTGVGLSLIEKSIHHWGGRLSLESTLGKGCKFTFTLPKERKINGDRSPGP